jgi:DNA-binding beta-propeller fold protein YncE
LLVIVGVVVISALGLAFAAGRGKLRFVNAKFDDQGGITGLGFAWDVVASPDGRSVYVTGDDDDAVVTFKRNRNSGKLRYVNTKVDGQNGIDGLALANGLAMSPDARNVYVTGAGDNSIVTFRRKPRTGKLKFVNAKFDGQGGVDGLGGAFEVAASPDGDSVYVASESDNAVATFKRGRRGKLKFLNAKLDGQGGAMLEYATGIQVAPDNRNVYVSAAHDNAVDTFKRNRRTGKLTFVNAKVDGQGGVNGIGSTFDLTVAPDGDNVYASGNSDSAVAAFKRTRKGRLRFIGAKFDGKGGVDGLAGAYLMSSSPDGDNVYVTADIDNSVVTFKRH